MNEVCLDINLSFEKYRSELFLSELYATHSLLKHELKTAILAQIRMFEYIIPKLGNKSGEFLELITLGYETSLNQYNMISKRIEYIKNILSLLSL